ncbi:hypothetical protein PVAP13_2NG584520 [Panicum virgatum]|uniref:Uncharacterized protein n=1 Tax=Panicum virgatum TaxID=38727 RepID=A0A8T0VQ50_PANVG|nr:hypothetical protein PVAP13_2NG584520 [Panicum virgatum]
MSNERGDQESTAATSSGASDWLDESIAFLAADLDVGLGAYGWLQASAEEEQQQGIDSMVAETRLPPTTTILPQSGLGPVSTSVASSPVASPGEFGQPRKRKSPQHSSQHYPVGGGPELDSGGTSSSRKPSKKGSAKPGAASLGWDARWAEQLLNPCAVAIEAGNLPRAQHLLYVLGELASFSGEPNHRLAAHGLRALTQRLPHAVGPAAAATVKMPPCECPTPMFSGVDPRLFRALLIRFNEVSPWFAVPNALANAAIAQAAGDGCGDRASSDSRRGHRCLARRAVADAARGAHPRATGLHAPRRPPHGRRPRGRPTGVVLRFTSRLRLLTAAAPVRQDHQPGPRHRANTMHGQPARHSHPRRDPRRLPPVPARPRHRRRAGSSTPKHQEPQPRATSPRRAGLRRPKRRQRGERVRGQAGASLDVPGLDGRCVQGPGRRREAGDGSGGRDGTGGHVEAWSGRGRTSGGEAVETAKALLRKYDGGWELVPPSPSSGAAVGLRWKGQPVSFCSLWRPAQASPELIWRGA